MERLSANTPTESPIFQQIKESLEKTTAETQTVIAHIQNKVATLGIEPFEANLISENQSTKSPAKDPRHTVINDLWDLHSVMRSNAEHLHLINEALTKLVGG